MERDINKNENENEENSSSTNNSINKINIFNRINNIDSPIYSQIMNNRSTEFKIISNICNVFTEICDSNKKKINKEKNFRTIKPFFTINPSIKIKDYLEQLYKFGKMEGSSLILMVIYIDRFCNINKIKLSHQIIHKLILSALIVAIKYNEDEMFSLKMYSRIGGVTQAELSFLELCFITCIDFNLYITDELYVKYHDYFADVESDDEDDYEEEVEEEGEKKENEINKIEEMKETEKKINSNKIIQKEQAKQNG